MPETPPPPETTATRHRLTFRLPDDDPEITGVRLWQQLRLGERARFRPDPAGGWTLRLPAAAAAKVRRLEYQYVLETDSGERWCLDPTNPLRVPGPFGEKSVLELPGYRAPAWLSVEPEPAGEFDVLSCESPAGPVEVTVWTPEVASGRDRHPLLVVHDGPELAEYARFLDYVRAMHTTGRLPALRVALLAPGERNPRYAANPDYADALADDVIPTLLQRFPTTGRPVIAGASLGGLAALHAEWQRPGTFAAVFAQSGSFFTPRTDSQESGFDFFPEITNFVARVHSARTAPTRAPVRLTCGAAEENLACNQRMSSTLARLGMDGALAIHPDLHTWTCWRDTFDPYLTELLVEVFGAP